MAVAPRRPRRAPAIAARSPTGTTRGSARASTAPSVELAPFWDLLARAKADVVLQGHDHHYERFAPIKGIRSFVVGTGGKSLYPTLLPRPGSVVRNADTYGVLRLTLRPTGYDWKFLPVAGRHVHATPARRAAASALDHGAGSEAPSGTNASWTTRSTFARRPSSTGARPVELEPAELDPSLRANGDEPEVLEEVAREHRAVDEQAAPRHGRAPA